MKQITWYKIYWYLSWIIMFLSFIMMLLFYFNKETFDTLHNAFNLGLWYIIYKHADHKWRELGKNHEQS